VQVDEDVVRLLLPYLLHGVGADSQAAVSPDYRTASHMILVQLCSIATLAKDFLEGANPPPRGPILPHFLQAWDICSFLTMVAAMC